MVSGVSLLVEPLVWLFSSFELVAGIFAELPAVGVGWSCLLCAYSMKRFSSSNAKLALIHFERTKSSTTARCCWVNGGSPVIGGRSTRLMCSNSKQMHYSFIVFPLIGLVSSGICLFIVVSLVDCQVQWIEVMNQSVESAEKNFILKKIIKKTPNWFSSSQYNDG